MQLPTVSDLTVQGELSPTPPRAPGSCGCVDCWEGVDGLGRRPGALELRAHPPGAKVVRPRVGGGSAVPREPRLRAPHHHGPRGAWKRAVCAVESLNVTCSQCEQFTGPFLHKDRDTTGLMSKKEGTPSLISFTLHPKAVTVLSTPLQKTSKTAEAAQPTCAALC